MSNSCDRSLNFLKRHDIKGGGVLGCMRTVYYIITKVFSCKKKKKGIHVGTAGKRANLAQMG